MQMSGLPENTPVYVTMRAVNANGLPPHVATQGTSPAGTPPFWLPLPPLPQAPGGSGLVTLSKLGRNALRVKVNLPNTNLLSPSGGLFSDYIVSVDPETTPRTPRKMERKPIS